MVARGLVPHMGPCYTAHEAPHGSEKLVGGMIAVLIATTLVARAIKAATTLLLVTFWTHGKSHKPNYAPLWAKSGHG